MFEGEAENCLIIVLDTVRAKSTFVEGKTTTPELQSVASEGTSFTKAITAAPWTLPSHASIYTGLYPTEHGATHQQKWLHDDHTTLAERLQASGIRTGLFTANMFLTESFNMDRGFDDVSFIRGEDNKLFSEGLDPIHFLNDREHDEGMRRFTEIARAVLDGPVAKNVANALYYKLLRVYRHSFSDLEPRSWDEQAVTDAQEFISAATATEQQFFGVVNLIGAHGPWEFDRNHLEAIGVVPEDIAPVDRWRSVAEHSEAQWPYAAGKIEFDATDREILTHLYEAWVHRVDELAGELIDHLEWEGVKEETIVIVTADHGECIGRDGVLGHELTVDDEVAHVPLAISGPGVPNTTVREPVSLKDIYGTTLTLLGESDSERHLWQEAAKGTAFIETYPVDPETVSEPYRETASTFGRRFALFTTDGWAERRERSGETFGDEYTLAELSRFTSKLSTHTTPIPDSERNFSEEVETRLRELGYKG